MRPRNLLNILTLLLLVLLATHDAHAQATAAPQSLMEECGAPQDFAQWVNCRIQKISTAQMNQRGITKEVEVPSIAENTTSLVDQSEAPDLLGVGLNLAGLSNKSNGNESSPAMSFTTTAYALYASALQRDPLDPDFYIRHPDLRRFSFTLGQDSDGEKAANDQKTATVVGFKYLLLNKRDASLASNRKLFQAISMRNQKAVVATNRIALTVRQYLYSELATPPGLKMPPSNEDILKFVEAHLENQGDMTATLALLSPRQMEEIDNIIKRNVETIVDLQEEIHRTFETIRRKPQVSFLFQSKQRKGMEDDEYRAGLTYDKGVYGRMNLTLNGTFDYKDRKIIGGDQRGGRLAGEGNFRLNPEKNIFEDKDPYLLSLAGESKWMTGAKPAYTFQAKLTIPIYNGLSLPISVSFASRRELINESKVRGHFGFTFDLSKLLTKK